MGRSQNRAALQPFLHQFPTLTNREMFWANRVFSGRNREFRRYSVRRPVLPRLPIIGGPCGPKVASGPLALRPPHPVSHCAIPGETARGRADRGPDLIRVAQIANAASASAAVISPTLTFRPRRSASRKSLRTSPCAAIHRGHSPVAWC
jgi:hypothetical protein